MTKKKKNCFKFSKIRDDDLWKANMVKELTEVKQGSMYLEDNENGNLLSKKEIEEIINYVTSS